MGRVVVVGSVGVWVRAQVETLPRPGEAATALRAVRTVGGRSVDKAVAARRAGAEVVLVGAVGDDADGAWCAAQVAGLGVEARLARVPGATTGLVVVAGEEGGPPPTTLLVPGADEDLAGHLEGALRDLRPDDVVLLDLGDAPAAVGGARDGPVGAVVGAVAGAVVSAAEHVEARVVLSASPYVGVPAAALEACSPCVVDERDAAALADSGLLPRSLCVVVEGSGAVWDGLRVRRRGGAFTTRPAADVLAGSASVVDRFCAALAAALAADPDPPSALRRAVAVIA